MNITHANFLVYEEHMRAERHRCVELAKLWIKNQESDADTDTLIELCHYVRGWIRATVISHTKCKLPNCKCEVGLVTTPYVTIYPI